MKLLTQFQENNVGTGLALPAPLNAFLSGEEAVVLRK
jgi:hypothetical protein